MAENLAVAHAGSLTPILQQVLLPAWEAGGGLEEEFESGNGDGGRRAGAAAGFVEGEKELAELLVVWRIERPPRTPGGCTNSGGQDEMRLSPGEKWRQYEQALLGALGFDEAPTAPHRRWYQALLIPSFHPPACVRLELTDQDSSLSMAVLSGQHSALFTAIWQEDQEAARQAQQEAYEVCVADIVGIGSLHAARYRQQLALLEPLALADVDLVARDGISARCTFQEETCQHSFNLRTVNASAAPRHGALLRILFTAVEDHCEQATLKELFQQVARYLAD